MGLFTTTTFLYLIISQLPPPVTDEGSMCEKTLIQRGYALGSINTNFEKTSETVGVDVEIVPYMIDKIDDKVTTAVSAVGGGNSLELPLLFLNIRKIYCFSENSYYLCGK